MALREQNAHIQRKVASGEGGEDILEGSEAQQKVHGKVSSLDLNMGGKNGQNYVWIYNNYTLIVCTLWQYLHLLFLIKI